MQTNQVPVASVYLSLRKQKYELLRARTRQQYAAARALGFTVPESRNLSMNITWDGTLEGGMSRLGKKEATQ